MMMMMMMMMDTNSDDGDDDDIEWDDLENEDVLIGIGSSLQGSAPSPFHGGEGMFGEPSDSPRNQQGRVALPPCLRWQRRRVALPSCPKIQGK